MHVSIVGAGYVGLVTGLCLADQGHQVTCIDIDADKIQRLTRGLLPIHEPGLGPLLEKHLGTRFFPTLDLEKAVRGSEVTMITVGTPVVNGAIDLSFIASASVAVGQALALKNSYHVVVVKSTVVPGTTDGLVRRLIEQGSGQQCGPDFGLGMNPEFLREGEAVGDFQHPDRIVIGANDQRARDVIAQLYAGYSADIISTNTRTAEMVKYASNALLATLISFSNEIGNLCTAAEGVDAVDVFNAVHLDRRISPMLEDGGRVTAGIAAYLKAGCGFGGSCFPKDVRALVHWGDEHHRSTRVLNAVLATNDRQPGETIAVLKRHFPRLAGLRIAVLGLAFKPDTDDVRFAPALIVIPQLLSEGAHVVAYDPIAASAAQAALGRIDVQYASTLEEALSSVDAVVLLTAWNEFRRIPDILDALGESPLVVDGRRILDKARITRYEGIGLASLQGELDGLGVAP